MHRGFEDRRATGGWLGLRVGVVGASLATILSLLACNEPAAPKAAADARAPAAAPAAAPCSVVPQAEMAALLGKPVTRQEERMPHRCFYATEDPLVYVDLEIDRESAAESWKGINAGNTLIGAAQDDLAGLGDQAFFGPRDRLYVLRGDTFIAVEAGFDGAVRERARKVAALALGKVP